MRTINYGALPRPFSQRLGQDDTWVDDPSGELFEDEGWTPEPSQPSPKGATKQASSEPGFFDQVGGFFSGLFTKENVKAAAQTLTKDGKKVSPAPLPAAVPATSILNSPSSLLVLGGLTVAAVVAVALITRKPE